MNPKTDPFGNQPGTVRGLLAIFFAVFMGMVIAAFVYRTEILNLPFVMPDAFTISFFTLGGTIIGSYFGVRSAQTTSSPIVQVDKAATVNATAPSAEPTAVLPTPEATVPATNVSVSTSATTPTLDDHFDAS